MFETSVLIPANLSLIGLCGNRE